jgi:hypothetical protein
MEQSLAQEFNDTAAAAYAAFPEQLARLVILLTPDTDTPVYVSPQVADELTKSTAEIREAVAKYTGVLKANNASGLAEYKASLAGTPVNLIALDSKNIMGIFTERFTKEMRAIFNLDHEIGHHIIRNGTPSLEKGVTLHKSECAADAFAMLRHIQRYGKNTDRAGNRSENIAYCITLLSDMVHYTSAALQQAFEVADKMGDDFFKLSLHETAELAATIADDTALVGVTLKKIAEAYLPVANYCKANMGNGQEIVRKLYDADATEAHTILCQGVVSVMANPANSNDPDIFNAGKRFLSAPQLKEFMTKAAATETGGYWKSALGFINTHKPDASQQTPRSTSPGMKP